MPYHCFIDSYSGSENKIQNQFQSKDLCKSLECLKDFERKAEGLVVRVRVRVRAFTTVIVFPVQE